MSLGSSDVTLEAAGFRRRPAVLADLLPGTWAHDAALVLGAAAFVGALSQIVIKLPFTPVPITGQTLGVLLAGCALGWRRAAAALTFYLLMGLAGVPWFASHASGWVSSLMGYLIGFVLAAAVCGWLAGRGSDRTVLRAVPTMIVGEIVMYAVAVPWLAVALHVSLGKAISLGFTPFIAGDSIKMAIAAGLLPATWRLTGAKSRTS